MTVDTTGALLSVVVPITRMHGRMKNLRSWLKNLDGNKVQVILVHDIQDLETSEELEELRKEFSDKKLVYLEGTFGNPGETRNYGKTMVTGEYLMFCDSDDVLHTENILESITKNRNCDILIGSYKMMDASTNITLTLKVFPRNLLDLTKSPGLWRFVFRKDLLDTHDFSPLSMGEDQLFLAKSGIFNHNIRIIHDCFYEYFVGDPNQLTSKRDKVRDLFPVLDELKNLQKSKNVQNQTFTTLLIVKNILTLIKNVKCLEAKNRLLIITKALPTLISSLFSLNLIEALRPLDRKK